MATNPKTTSEKKLWIGNLDKRLTEYNLLKVIQCYGEVENFEYLFHTVGPHKGEPRTYCFVEYKNKENADLALKKLNGKMVMSRALQVRWAEETVKCDKGEDPHMKRDNSALKKTGSVLSSYSCDDKIKAIEAKLKLMEDAGENKTRPAVFHGKHPLLGQSKQQQKETTRKTRRKLRHPYHNSKNSSRS